jgi:hypothetical protein
MFVVPFSKCKNIVEKSINRRARTREAVERSIATQTRTYHGGQAFIASDFSSRDLSWNILRLEMQKQRPKSMNSQKLRLESTSSKQPKGN